MDFVDKQNWTGVVEESVALGFLNDLAHILHTAGYGTERIEGSFELFGNDCSQCGFAHSRRSPKNETGDTFGLNHLTQNTTLANQMWLANIVVKRRRTHTFCQRCAHNEYKNIKKNSSLGKFSIKNTLILQHDTFNSHTCVQL